jgi:hypothetical protein
VSRNVSYGTAYHNGADCEECGVRIMWESMSAHRAWHDAQVHRFALLREAVLDLIEVVYRGYPEMTANAKELFDTEWHRWEKVNSEGVDSE